MDEKSSHTEQSESTQISSIPKGLPDQQQYYAPEPKEHRYDKIANRWKLFKESWRTIGLDRKIELSLAAAIFFAAAVSGSVAYFQWGAMVESNRINKRTMIAANRAWLAPITVELEDGFAQSGRLHFTVQFGNVGKEPAIDFVAQQEIGFIFRPTANQNLYDIFPEAKITDVCKGTQSSRGAGTFYPSNLRDYKYQVFTGPQDRNTLASVAKGDQGVFIHGCFAYKTFGIERKSEYCFVRVLLTVNSSKKTLQFSRCPYGNHVHGPDDEK